MAEQNPFEEIIVTAQSDHLNDFWKSQSPVDAIAELIWNGLDAGANIVSVDFDINDLGGINKVKITDDGTGIDRNTIQESFGHLGGSPKRWKTENSANRIMHGKLGKGRFKAFRLGSPVVWNTTHHGASGLVSFDIRGISSSSGKFSVSAPKASTSMRTGTIVEAFDGDKLSSLTDEKTFEKINQMFAVYLRTYPEVSVFYQDRKLDPSLSIIDVKDYAVSGLEAEGIPALDLQIVEWKQKPDFDLALCDERGNVLKTDKIGGPALGYDFTAYARSKSFRSAYETDVLDIANLDQAVGSLIRQVRDKVTDHFTEKTAIASANIIERWRSEGVYPYSGNPESNLATAKRQMFDIVVANVERSLPSFVKGDVKQRRFAMRLIMQALEQSPDSLIDTIQEVLGLPNDELKDLSRLLERTSISAIIAAAKSVADRLDFVRRIEDVIFNPLSAGSDLVELYECIGDNLWILGDAYASAVIEPSLSGILTRAGIYLGAKGPSESSENGNAKTQDGGFIIARTISIVFGQHRENIVLIIHPPSSQIDQTSVLGAIRFADEASADAQYATRNTQWSIWLLGTTFDTFVDHQSNQKDRELGLLSVAENYKIWVRRWSDIRDECRNRLTFYQERLNYQSDSESAFTRIRVAHEEFLHSPHNRLQNRSKRGRSTNIDSASNGAING